MLLRAVCPAEAGVMSELQTPVHFTSAVVTSFNLRVVRILCGRGCLTAGQDQTEIASSESVVLYSALERCGEQWERREHMSGGSIALTHPSAFIPFISYLV